MDGRNKKKVCSFEKSFDRLLMNISGGTFSTTSKDGYTVRIDKNSTVNITKGNFESYYSTVYVSGDNNSVTIENGKGILDLLLDLKFVQSKGEAKRLIQGGGVKIDGNKISDLNYTVNIDSEAVLQAGKRKFAKLIK